MVQRSGTAAMAVYHFVGLRRHPRTGLWEYRRAIPRRLRAACAGQWEFKRTTGTDAKLEAVRRALPIIAEFHSLLASLEHRVTEATTIRDGSAAAFGPSRESSGARFSTSIATTQRPSNHSRSTMPLPTMDLGAAERTRGRVTASRSLEPKAPFHVPAQIDGRCRPSASQLTRSMSLQSPCGRSLRTTPRRPSRKLTGKPSADWRWTQWTAPSRSSQRRRRGEEWTEAQFNACFGEPLTTAPARRPKVGPKISIRGLIRALESPQGEVRPRHSRALLRFAGCVRHLPPTR